MANRTVGGAVSEMYALRTTITPFDGGEIRMLAHPPALPASYVGLHVAAECSGSPQSERTSRYATRHCVTGREFHNAGQQRAQPGHSRRGRKQHSRPLFSTRYRFKRGVQRRVVERGESRQNNNIRTVLHHEWQRPIRICNIAQRTVITRCLTEAVSAPR